MQPIKYLAISNLLFQCLLFAQETKVIAGTDIYSEPSNQKSVVGKLLPGTTVSKLEKDKSGQYIKATIEFYIPLSTLEESRVSKKIGETQNVDNAIYKLLEAAQDGNSVYIALQVTNNSSYDLDFVPLMLLKVTGIGNNVGNLNPFKGINQDFVSIRPNQTITAKLYYEFNKNPKNVELMCTGKFDGDRVYYNLGF